MLQAKPGRRSKQQREQTSPNLGEAFLAEPCSTYFSSPCEDREPVACGDPGDGLGLEGLDAVRPRPPTLDLFASRPCMSASACSFTATRSWIWGHTPTSSREIMALWLFCLPKAGLMPPDSRRQWQIHSHPSSHWQTHSLPSWQEGMRHTGGTEHLFSPSL